MNHILIFDTNKCLWRNMGEYLDPFAAREYAKSYREEDLDVLIVDDDRLEKMHREGRVHCDDVLEN